jgi:hypothetical protein
MTMTTDTTTGRLPAQFADLEPFAEWILETHNERYDHRLAVSMDVMQAFYDAAFPRLADIIEYCNKFPLDDMPDDVRNLMLLTFSLVHVSFPVEVWRQARVPDSGAAAIDCVREPIF